MKNFNNLFEQLKKAGRFVSGPAKKPFKPEPMATPVREAEEKMKGEDPCWKGYEMVGMKNKNGKKVPNCVPVKEETDSSEKSEMAQTQLHFIKYAAEEILEYIEMGGEIEEWYQNKLSKVQSEVESLHSYIEGESRRTGMKEETEQLDELMQEPNYNQSIKARQAAADKKKEDVPFDPPYSKKTSATGGKYGQGYSTARHLARQALQKQLKKPVKESLEESRKAEIVKQASKDAKKKTKEKVSDDKFEAEPTLDSEIIKT